MRFQAVPPSFQLFPREFYDIDVVSYAASRSEGEESEESRERKDITFESLQRRWDLLDGDVSEEPLFEARSFSSLPLREKCRSRQPCGEGI